MAQPIKRVWLGPDALLTALGDKQQTLHAIEAKQSGLTYQPAWGMPVGAIPSTHPLAQPVAGFTRLESAMIRVLEEVIAQAGITPGNDRVQILVASTKGNIEQLQGCGDEPPKEAFLFEMAQHIADHFHASRTPIVVSNACISGVTALIVGQRLLQSGECDHALVVGGDMLSRFITEGFASFHSISALPCRPYDAARDGLSLGEACAAVLLTTHPEMAQQPAIELLGGAITNDANHISGPSRTGDGLYYAIHQALEEAALTPDDIGLVNTHGTATLYNDEMESKAIAWAQLEHTPLNSLKGYIGHTLGAAGVVESLLSAEALRRGIVYGTQGFTTPGTSCAVNISAEHRPLGIPACVKTASGFGGCNAALVMRRQETLQTPEAATSRPLKSIRCRGRYTLPHFQQPFAEGIREAFRALHNPNMKFYKMSDLSKALYVAVEQLLEQSDSRPQEAPTEWAIVLSNHAASLDTDLQHQHILDRQTEPPSPAIFVYTLPNVAVGEVCIRHHLQGENTFFIEACQNTFGRQYASLLLTKGYARHVICGWCDLLNGRWDVQLELLETDD